MSAAHPVYTKLGIRSKYPAPGTGLGRGNGYRSWKRDDPELTAWLKPGSTV